MKCKPFASDDRYPDIKKYMVNHESGMSGFTPERPAPDQQQTEHKIAFDLNRRNPVGFGVFRIGFKVKPGY